MFKQILQGHAISDWAGLRNTLAVIAASNLVEGRVVEAYTLRHVQIPKVELLLQGVLDETVDSLGLLKFKAQNGLPLNTVPVSAQIAEQMFDYFDRYMELYAKAAETLTDPPGEGRVFNDTHFLPLPNMPILDEHPKHSLAYLLKTKQLEGRVRVWIHQLKGSYTKLAQSAREHGVELSFVNPVFVEHATHDELIPVVKVFKCFQEIRLTESHCNQEE